MAVIAGLAIGSSAVTLRKRWKWKSPGNSILCMGLPLKKKSISGKSLATRNLAPFHYLSRYGARSKIAH